jgi:predicted patatin/cPLA2 family phospholipase
VGGGMRGIYAAGVLDCCLDVQVTFDAGIGISAGSANIASFLAHQRGRNKRYFLEYSFRKEYMSLSNYRTKGSFWNLDYIYGRIYGWSPGKRVYKQTRMNASRILKSNDVTYNSARAAFLI